MNMKNTLTKAAAAFLFAVSLCTPHARAYTTPVDIAVNGSIIKTDSPPYIDSGTAFVPIRFVSEALGAAVVWDSGNISIKTDTTDILLTAGSRTAYVNGKKHTLPAKVHIINGRTYLPARRICELLGADVKWVDGYHTVYITKDGAVVPANSTDSSYTFDEIFWLGRIIEAESSGEPKDGKIAVGNVILNRVKSSEYPDTIYGVIFDRKYGTQFQPVSNGTIYNNPSADSLSSAKLALSGTNLAGRSLYFLNPKISTNFWIVNNRRFYKSIGNHDFYL